jgi:hypothetical protein
MFGQVDDMSAHHEPYPQMDREILERCNNGDTRLMSECFWRVKVPRILWAAKGASWYLESSHLFIVTYAYLAAKCFGPRMQVVHLRRDPHAVAASFMARGQDPLHDPWLVKPGASANCLQMAHLITGGGRYDHAFYRLFWYCYEVEARTLQFARTFPEIRVHQVNTDDLNRRSRVRELCDALGVRMNESVAAAVGTRANRSKQLAVAASGLSDRDVDAFSKLCQERLKEFAEAAVAAPNKAAPGVRAQ